MLSLSTSLTILAAALSAVALPLTPAPATSLGTITSSATTTAAASLMASPIVTDQPRFIPLAPGSGDVFTEGGECNMTWLADTTGANKTYNVELMAGNNLNMTHLTTIGSFNGSDPNNTTLTYTCLKVSPHSPIYFYQFTAEGEGPSWTNRFAITDETGAITPPVHQTQPTGDPIPWGEGLLINSSQSVAPPSTAPPGQPDVGHISGL